MHFIILLLMLPIRQIFVDTIFLRDFVIILVLLSCILLKVNVLYSSRIHYLVASYLFLGVFLMLAQFLMGVAINQVLLGFRNYFFPMILFFFAFKIFRSDENKLAFLRFIFFIFLLLIFDIWFEYLYFKTDLPKSVLPWYAYQFENSYRFTSSDVANVDSVDPSQTPILGILGWPHATSATFLSIFLFLFPFIFDAWKLNFFRLNKLKKFLIFLFSFGAVIVLGVKMQIIFLLFALPLMVMLDYRTYLSKFLKVVPIGLFVLILTRNFWFETIINRWNIAFIGTESADASFGYIFDRDIFSGVFEALFSGNYFFLFFGGLSSMDFWFLEFLEIRLISYTLDFGVIWLVLFVFLLFFTCYFAFGRYKGRITPFESYTYFGFILFVLSFLFDSLHYFRLMNFPNLDMLAVMLGMVFQKSGYDEIS